jgi:FMN phosphatase YigB (HAD superfamily)
VTVDAVLFDFSATLFDPARVVDGAALADQAGRAGVPLDRNVANEMAARILAHADTEAAKRTRVRCDLSAAEHRLGWLATATGVPGVTPMLAEAFHCCITRPDRWLPYPDTGAVLNGLKAAGVRVGVVSNCGWDIRAAFRGAGLHHLIDGWVLSFEHGVAKPDPEPFRLACAALGVPPARALMVGDDPDTDTGALAVGMPVHLLPPAPPYPSPRGLGTIRHLAGPA